MLKEILRIIFSLTTGGIINFLLVPVLNAKFSKPPATGVTYYIIWGLSCLGFSAFVLLLTIAHNPGKIYNEENNEDAGEPNFLTSSEIDPEKIPIVEEI